MDMRRFQSIDMLRLAVVFVLAGCSMRAMHSGPSSTGVPTTRWTPACVLAADEPPRNFVCDFTIGAQAPQLCEPGARGAHVARAFAEWHQFTLTDGSVVRLQLGGDTTQTWKFFEDADDPIIATCRGAVRSIERTWTGLSKERAESVFVEAGTSLRDSHLAAQSSCGRARRPAGDRRFVWSGADSVQRSLVLMPDPAPAPAPRYIVTFFTIGWDGTSEQGPPERPLDCRFIRDSILVI